MNTLNKYNKIGFFILRINRWRKCQDHDSSIFWMGQERQGGMTCCARIKCMIKEHYILLNLCPFFPSSSYCLNIYFPWLCFLRHRKNLKSRKRTKDNFSHLQDLSQHITMPITSFVWKVLPSLYSTTHFKNAFLGQR